MIWMLTCNQAGSFPHTLPQCLMDMNVSGKSSKNSFLSNWVSPGNPTRLFQLLLGNGQHAFSAHGMCRDPTHKLAFSELNQRARRMLFDKCRSLSGSRRRHTDNESMAIGDQK